jgi:hypothetical protein
MAFKNVDSIVFTLFFLLIQMIHFQPSFFSTCPFYYSFKKCYTHFPHFSHFLETQYFQGFEANFLFLFFTLCAIIHFTLEQKEIIETEALP